MGRFWGDFGSRKGKSRFRGTKRANPPGHPRIVESGEWREFPSCSRNSPRAFDFFSVCNRSATTASSLLLGDDGKPALISLLLGFYRFSFWNVVVFLLPSPWKASSPQQHAAASNMASDSMKKVCYFLFQGMIVVLLANLLKLSLKFLDATLRVYQEMEDANFCSESQLNFQICYIFLPYSDPDPDPKLMLDLNPKSDPKICLNSDPGLPTSSSLPTAPTAPTPSIIEQPPPPTSSNPPPSTFIPKDQPIASDNKCHTLKSKEFLELYPGEATRYLQTQSRNQFMDVSLHLNLRFYDMFGPFIRDSQAKYSRMKEFNFARVKLGLSDVTKGQWEHPIRGQREITPSMIVDYHLVCIHLWLVPFLQEKTLLS
ncbi:hypothetical protein Taro_012814 [Colocasia esculenta]|uniref:Uncharacterized protein n=1 Tax=Colocasia esculenta TaxID=4460 RepID=A0A843UKB1_COLES|nr:hypothetical protein [Colocasia esculenta]